MNLYEIVMKLVGPVCPTGDHNTDQERLKNMKALIELVDRLLFDIGEVEQYAEAPDASMKAIGVHARDFLKGTKEAITYYD